MIPSWVAVVTGISLAILALAAIAIALSSVIAVLALRTFLRILEHLAGPAVTDLRQLVATIRTEAESLVGTSRDLRGRIVKAADAQAPEEALKAGQLVAATAAALAGIVLLPAVAHAWTPGTHVYLGESVLANLHQLPAALADLLRAFPYDYLYGNIAADTSLAKKYAPVGRHCHAWHVGQEIS